MIVHKMKLMHDGSMSVKEPETIEPASEFESEATLSAPALRRFDLIAAVAHR